VEIGKDDIKTMTEYKGQLSSSHSKRKARALTRDQILKYLTDAPNEGVHLRTKVALVIGVFALGRFEEIAQLHWEDVSFRDNSIVIDISRAKTTAERKAQQFVIPSMLEAVNFQAIVQQYKDETGGTNFMWRRFSNGRWSSDSARDALGKSTLAETPLTVASWLDLPDAGSYTGHGLRAAGATFMVESGASAVQLMNAGNWHSIGIADGYVRDSTTEQQKRAAMIAGDILAPQPTEPQAPQLAAPQAPQPVVPQMQPVINFYGPITHCTFNM